MSARVGAATIMLDGVIRAVEDLLEEPVAADHAAQALEILARAQFALGQILV